VEFQSTSAATTQGTVAAYLRSKPVADVMFINSGLHDMLGGIQMSDYVQNVRETLEALAPVSKTVVWVLISKPMPSFAEEAKVREWNKAICEMIAKEFPRILVLNAFKMSQVNDMHIDEVHLTPVYYKSVAKIMLGFAMQDASIRKDPGMITVFESVSSQVLEFFRGMI